MQSGAIGGNREGNRGVCSAPTLIETVGVSTVAPINVHGTPALLYASQMLLQSSKETSRIRPGSSAMSVAATDVPSTAGRSTYTCMHVCVLRRDMRVR